MPSGSPSTVASFWMRTCDQGNGFIQMTGLNSMVCGEMEAPAQVESTSPFSAVPATMPKSLICNAAPLLPSVPPLLRSLGRATMGPFCHRNGTQVLPLWVRPSAADPQKSSPFGSGVCVSACPAACPQMFTPYATLFGPPSPGLLIIFVLVPSHKTACDIHSAGLLGLARTVSPLTSPLPLTVNGWPCDHDGPTGPRSTIMYLGEFVGCASVQTGAASVARARLSRARRGHFGTN